MQGADLLNRVATGGAFGLEAGYIGMRGRRVATLKQAARATGAASTFIVAFGAGQGLDKFGKVTLEAFFFFFKAN